MISTIDQTQQDSPPTIPVPSPVIIVINDSDISGVELLADVLAHESQCFCPTSNSIEVSSHISSTKNLDSALLSSSTTINYQTQPYYIDNKYYTATVDLCVFQIKDIIHSKLPDQFLANVDGFIYLFNYEKSSAFSLFSRLVSHLDVVPAVCMCIGLPNSTKMATSTPLSQNTVQSWENECIEHNFDLMLLCEHEENISEEGLGSTFANREGALQNIVSTLHANRWSGLVRKEDGSDLATLIQSSLTLQPTNNEVEPEKSESENFLPLESDVNEMHKRIFGELDSEDGFEKALLMIQSLRDDAKNLPLEERHELAAKVALSFAKHLNL